MCVCVCLPAHAYMWKKGMSRGYLGGTRAKEGTDGTLYGAQGPTISFQLQKPKHTPLDTATITLAAGANYFF